MTADFTMFSGDSRILTILIKDEAGVDVDVSAADTILYGIFKKDGTVILQKALLSGITVAGNVVSITLLPSETQDIAPGQYMHECQISLLDGTVATVMQGQLHILRDFLT